MQYGFNIKIIFDKIDNYFFKGHKDCVNSVAFSPNG